MALERRSLEFTFALGKGSFGGSGFNTLSVTDVRAIARISNAGGAMSPQFDATINGLTLSQMNQLTTLGSTDQTIRYNSIEIKAGTRGQKMAVVFTGTIRKAWFDGTAAPEVGFRMQGDTMSFDAVKPVDALSYKGSANTVDMLQTIADRMKVKFENNGVKGVMLTDQNLPRSSREMILTILKAGGIEWNGVEKGVLAIWPKNTGYRKGDVVRISPDSGQVLYPMMSQVGIQVRSLFNPALRFGAQMEVSGSILQPALKNSNSSNLWVIKKLDHELAAETPGGPWFSDITGQVPGFTGGVGGASGSSTNTSGGSAAP